jgi:hypothetical protein
VLYDKDKGFQFIDLEGASIEGDATTKFLKDGKNIITILKNTHSSHDYINQPKKYLC